jgi:PucR C-terminal helix-turn-helix domain/GGDEF-like domain
VPDYGEASPRLRALVTSLLAERDELARRLAAQITTDIEFYRTSEIVGLSDLEAISDAQLGAFLGRIAHGPDFDTTAARESGRDRAAAGVPIAAVMDAYRVGVAFIWDTIVEASGRAGIPGDDLVAVTAQLWSGQEKFTQAMAEGYRQEATARLLAQDAERGALVEALLRGQVLADATLWEVAGVLGLPRRGPFVVVVAALADLGRHALPAIETHLAVVDLRSAWRLLPDLQVGIVCVPDQSRRSRLLEELRKYHAVRQGVSPAYPELSATGEALRLARITMSTAPRSGGVREFDDDALSIAAVAAPDVTSRLVASVLGPLRTMRPDDREILLHTLEVWLDRDGSADLAAERLFCHPNTVRQRLRRIEERTGRSLAKPRELAELCLALDVERHIGDEPLPATEDTFTT